MGRNAMNVMREHGAYPLDDTLKNDLLLAGVVDDDCFASMPTLYIDGNGNHLIWFQTKKNDKGEQVWHGEQLEVEFRSVEVDTTLARQLNYLGETPGFDDGNAVEKKTIKPEETQGVADGAPFIIVGMREDGHTHINSLLIAEDGRKYHMIKNVENSVRNTVLTHIMAAAVVYDLRDEEIIDSDNHDLLNTVKGLMK